MPTTRRATERTLYPLELLSESLAEFDLTVEGALFGFAWMHNRNDELSGSSWQQFCERSTMPILQRIHFDFAMEHVADQAAIGFPIFFGMATVTMCGYLEGGIREFAQQWIHDHAASWKQDPIKRIALPAASFARMSHKSRCAQLFDALELSLRSSASGRTAKPGVEPLQRLLGSIGIAPQLPKAVSGPVNEMYAVRNQILHHGGRITPRFAELCPHFAGSRGKLIRIKEVRFRDYQSATHTYIDLIAERAREVAELPTD
jgi:hypothetical protein